MLAGAEGRGYVAAARPSPRTPRLVNLITPSRAGRALFLGLVLGAARLHGQTTEEPAPQPTPAGRELKLVPGVRYGAPLGASVYGGVVLGRKDAPGIEGPSVFGEAAQDGMRVSAGISSVSLGGTLRAQLSFIRTWNTHGDIEANQSFIGPEIAVGLIAGLTAGHYWRIGDGGGKSRFFAIGSFIGF